MNSNIEPINENQAVHQMIHQVGNQANDITVINFFLW